MQINNYKWQLTNQSINQSLNVTYLRRHKSSTNQDDDTDIATPVTMQWKKTELDLYLQVASQGK